jgi:hypothetical protein
VQHNIDTGTSKPHKEPPRRVPYHLQDEVNDTIDKLLQKGIIEPSSWCNFSKEKDKYLHIYTAYFQPVVIDVLSYP